ncbi:DegT/DnrJ/EryC1/StrS family aminotransferase [Phascolarctobacterium faecium]|jgi:UDP-2-acetamido-2-deoxy-ribo-hexuluronate aminotransferase|uniref:DegT/DnrJ/EryC1/StrS family aminotransferase n=1 Tax=Phascolarctobacterium faecium TaxID=33025 RepID=UPI0026760FE6|nr:DegT/DnrJ/EryC1/StrS aminotransferase family protein [Phascolarctobacterium faecium]
MEFIDLHAQYLQLRDEINANIQKVLDHGKYIMGPEVFELEDQLADYVGVQHCITCANGTDALQMVLMAWNIKAGDAVFVPSFTFMSTAEVVSLQGATPVFTDIDIKTFNMSAESLEKQIKKVLAEGKLTPKAIIPVDLFGQPADYEQIGQIAQKYNLLVLEDAAQGFGGNINGKMACSFGDAATTSFFPAKPLGCYGDGGAVFTDSDELANLLKSIRIHGKGTEKYDNVRIGLNSRLDTIQAAILLPKLKAFKEYELQKRNEIACRYTESLKGKYTTPFVPNNIKSSWAQYTLLLNNEEERNSLQSKLKEHNIPSMIYYPKPLHLQTCYKDLEYKCRLINSENASKCVLSLPMSPWMDECDIIKILKFL